jgi:hypothetical protein
MLEGVTMHYVDFIEQNIITFENEAIVPSPRWI